MNIGSVNRGATINRSVQRSQTQSRTTSRRFQQQQGVAQPNISSAVRSSGQTRVLSQGLRQCRFASSFAGRSNARVAGIAAHRAWRSGFRAGFVPWYGPVFWPYAYSDLFDYAFWPDGYDDGYWFYAYDDFFDGVFWGELAQPDYYASAPSVSSSRVSYAAVEELCTQPGAGITAWLFADIERKVNLTDAQKQLLNNVRKAGSDAAASFKASCPAESAFPLTPPGRLTAMTARINATLQAVETMRPPLEAFYNSLSDEQKERFNRIGPEKPSANAEAVQASANAPSCKEQKPGLTNLPMERIAAAIKPTDAQQAALNDLGDATAKAVSILQAACPEEMPLTPTGRLAAMETRLQAMIEAANTVKPALESFYGSLSSEQKARFNRIGRELAQTSAND